MGLRNLIKNFINEVFLLRPHEFKLQKSLNLNKVVEDRTKN